MKHCLIVDDSEVIRKVARRIIESLDIEVSEAEDGQQGLEHCRARTPDIILLDWLLSDMTGIEFMAALRVQASVPYIIYCTTENDTDDISRALSAGARAYLLKPFNRDELQAAMSDAGLI